jgi:hypothetical protein
MAKMQTTVVIRRPIDDCGSTGPGTTFRFRQQNLGKIRETTPRFIAIDPTRKIEFEAEIGPHATEVRPYLRTGSSRRPPQWCHGPEGLHRPELAGTAGADEIALAFVEARRFVEDRPRLFARTS